MTRRRNQGRRRAQSSHRRAQRRGVPRRPKSRRPSRGRPLLRSLLAVVLLGVVALAALFTWSFRPASDPQEGWIAFGFQSEQPAVVIDQLAEAGLVESPQLMKLYVSLLAPGVEFRPRSHLLRFGLSPRQLVQRLAEIGPRETATVTIPEGWSRWQIAQRLENEGIAGSRAFLDAVGDPALLEELGVPADSAEGYLFPATYEFHLDSDPARVVSRLVREAQGRFDELRRREEVDTATLEALGFGPHEVVTLASIVEKETGTAAERPRIARVFLNRLSRPRAGTKGRLQSDPTAMYGCRLLPQLASCADSSGRASPKVLRDGQNPYNTYRFAGLPPGPIGNPGEQALLAVLSPAEGDELYFVADGTGTHTFSEDYEAHKKAVKKLRDQRGRSFGEREKSKK